MVQKIYISRQEIFKARVSDLIKLNGLRKITYVGTENKIRFIIGNVTINNDIVSIVPKNDAAGEITLFKERIIQIERINNKRGKKHESDLSEF